MIGCMLCNFSQFLRTFRVCSRNLARLWTFFFFPYRKRTSCSVSSVFSSSSNVFSSVRVFSFLPSDRCFICALFQFLCCVACSSATSVLLQFIIFCNRCAFMNMQSTQQQQQSQPAGSVFGSHVVHVVPSYSTFASDDVREPHCDRASCTLFMFSVVYYTDTVFYIIIIMHLWFAVLCCASVCGAVWCYYSC